MPPFSPETLTWTGLLGRWIEFAQASMAIAESDDGDLWRASVADVIRLQAVTFALGDLSLLDAADRPFAVDRATVVVEAAVADLNAIWTGTMLPESLAEMFDDARRGLDEAPWRGATELLWPGPGSLVVPELPSSPIGGTLALMQPGTLAMPGEPVAWWIDRDPEPLLAALPTCRAEAVPLPRQVYRVITDDGHITEDVMVPISADPIPGLPLLVPICHRGEPIGHFTVDAEIWQQQQEAALAGGTIPVRAP